MLEGQVYYHCLSSNQTQYNGMINLK